MEPFEKVLHVVVQCCLTLSLKESTNGHIGLGVQMKMGKGRRWNFRSSCCRSLGLRSWVMETT